MNFYYLYKYYFELIASCNTSDSSFTDGEDDEGEDLKCDEKFVDSGEFDNRNVSESEESEEELKVLGR